MNPEYVLSYSFIVSAFLFCIGALLIAHEKKKERKRKKVKQTNFKPHDEKQDLIKHEQKQSKYNGVINRKATKETVASHKVDKNMGILHSKNNDKLVDDVDEDFLVISTDCCSLSSNKNIKFKTDLNLTPNIQAGYLENENIADKFPLKETSGDNLDTNKINANTADNRGSNHIINDLSCTSKNCEKSFNKTSNSSVSNNISPSQAINDQSLLKDISSECVIIQEETVLKTFPDGTILNEITTSEITEPIQTLKNNKNSIKKIDEVKTKIDTEIKVSISKDDMAIKSNELLNHEKMLNFSSTLSDQVLITAFLQVNKLLFSNQNKKRLCDKGTISPCSYPVLNEYIDSILKEAFAESYNDIRKTSTKDKRLLNECSNCLKKDKSVEVVNLNINKTNGLKDNNVVTENLKSKKPIDSKKILIESDIDVNVLANNILTVNEQQDPVSKKTENLSVLNNYAIELVNELIDATPMSFKNLSLRKFSLKTKSKNKTDNNDKFNAKLKDATGKFDKKEKQIYSNDNGIEEKPLTNGILHNTVDIKVLNGDLKPDILVVNDVNTEIKLSITDGVVKDDSQNVARLNSNNTKHRPVSDRPLSGFAENLAKLLADEDDLEFFDSDEELHESLEKVKETFSTKQAISSEIEKMQRRYSVDELNDYGGKKLKTQVDNKKKNSNRKSKYRSRGERPKSLFDQDILLDFLNSEPEVTTENDTTMTESEEDDEFQNSDEEIQPVQATIELFENVIPLIPPTSNITEYDTAFEEILKTQHSYSNDNHSSGKTPSLRRAAVIDFGCGVLKAGICGEKKPSCYCPSVIGTPRRFSQDVSKMKKGYYVGDEAWSYAGMLQIDHPIHQNISNWSDVTNMLEHLLEFELNINDSEHPILLTEMSLTTTKHREKLTEIMFEKFGVPAYYLANEGVLAMYSMGLVSGVCLNSGFNVTQAIPIYEGHALPYATKQLDIGGKQVTDYLGRMLQGNSGFTFNSSSEKLVLNSMKQSVCYISLEPNKEEEKYREKSNLNALFTLPDGQVIEIGSERSVATEILFQPEMLGLQQPSTAELIPECFDSMNPELYDTLSSNILVTGGNTKLKGYGQRLEHELSFIYNNANTNLQYADDRIFSTWIGGSVLSSITVFRDQWITMDQYAETGSKIVSKVCF